MSVRGLEHSAAVHVQSQCLAVLGGREGRERRAEATGTEA